MKEEFMPPQEVIDEVWYAYLKETKEFNRIHQLGDEYIKDLKSEAAIKAITFTLAYLKETKPSG